MAKSKSSKGSDAQRTGLKELDRKLAELSGTSARKAVRAGNAKATTVITKAIRSEISAAGASPQMKRGLKRQVGKKVGTAKGGTRKGRVEAKAGLGVGKVGKKAVKRSGKNKSGVGITAETVHWFALGTGPRVVRSTGKPSGRITPIPAVRRAFQKSRNEALKVLREITLQKMQEEVQRVARK